MTPFTEPDPRDDRLRRAIESLPEHLRPAGDAPDPVLPKWLAARVDLAAREGAALASLARTQAARAALSRRVDALALQRGVILPPAARLTTPARLRWLADEIEREGPRDPAWLSRWRAHIAEVARSLGVRVVTRHDCLPSSWAHQTVRTILVPRVRSAASYSTSLHELGHCACRAEGHRHRAAREPGKRIAPAGEICAWRWSIRHAKPRWTRTMQGNLAEALSTYLADSTPTERCEMRALITHRGETDV